MRHCPGFRFDCLRSAVIGNCQRFSTEVGRMQVLLFRLRGQHRSVTAVTESSYKARISGFCAMYSCTRRVAADRELYGGTPCCSPYAYVKQTSNSELKDGTNQNTVLKESRKRTTNDGSLLIIRCAARSKS